METKMQITFKSFIGMKDVDGNYILSKLDSDIGYQHTLQVLITELDYSSVKKLLTFDYKALTKPLHFTTQANKYNQEVRIPKNLEAFTAKEMDDLFEDVRYKLAYIFYPKERVWRVYELPNQNQILQAP